MQRILLFMGMLIATFSLQAQITTSSMSGKITGAQSEELFGAAVTAVHIPSGTTYGTTSQENGRFTIPNMRVGGPYTVTVSYLGFTDASRENIFLSLGQKYIADMDLSASATQLDVVVISAGGGSLFDKDKTGASTSISRDQIATLPTISRSASDYTRLNPMAAEGGSFGGRNDQFNNYSVNGTIFNNPFGLDAATVGGQADAQPISLDAIDQIQVSIAPYDVTQSGFTGAAINAVTKSGTNKFEGTAYGFFSSSSMIGGKVGKTKVNKGDLSSSQYGFAFGGPIIKNKLFFFANLELQNRSDLGSYFLPSSSGATGSNVSRVLESDMIKVSSLLKSNFGYETGAIKDFYHDANNTKGLVRLDVNLNKNHKLSASYNFLDAFKDKPAHPSAIGPRGPSLQTIQFQNAGYRINNGLQSGIVELKSTFGNKFSNKLQATMSAFRDKREPLSSPFPVINIGKDGSRYIIAGHEPFSINNNLNQDVFSIQNNFNIYLNNHILTVGASYEKFQFDNSFNLTGYGARVFSPNIDIADVETVFNSPEFATEVAQAKLTFDANNKNNKWALAETNIGQVSLYGQDEITVNDKLTVTAGLRIDVPQYFDTKTKIQENIARNGGLTSAGGVYSPEITYYDENGKAVKFDHTVLPESTPLINPRLGFNYKANESLQLRGGSGMFTGRLPFVWVGNQVANPAFFFYCVTAPDFKLPQIWRTNLGYDVKLNKGWTSTVDLLFTKDINAQMTRNYGLITPTGSLSGPGGRPVYSDTDRAQGPFGGATNAYVFTNTNLGYSFNASAQLQKSWETMSVMIGYNFLDAKDAASIDAEISSDAYDRNPANILNTNVADLNPSLYGNKHRVIGSFSKKFNYSNDRMATTIGLFTEYAKGGRYSYTYSGDINNDGSGLNDLMYIPTDAEIDQMNFTGGDAQKLAFKNYIKQDDYLTERRGQFAEKYAALSPWYNHWDLRLLQDVAINKSNKVQLSIDILNVGNLISSSWGVRQYASYTGLAQPVAVTVDKVTSVPTYTFDVSQKSTYFDDFNLPSRWQMQVGLRYIFK
jgi:Carboxypeptidase regulatory-like domain/TonB dependent receptor